MVLRQIIKLSNIIYIIFLPLLCSCSPSINPTETAPVKEFSSTWSDCDQFYYDEFLTEYRVLVDYEENQREKESKESQVIMYEVFRKRHNEIIEKALHDGYSYYRIERIAREPAYKDFRKYLENQ